MDGIIGSSPAMQEVFRIVRHVAGSRATVLLTGQSGTGKSALARAIHTTSPRAHHPFVTLHCAALADSLLESELFGHERGAFTGAETRRAGRFEQADRGTMFLDEVGEVPAQTQVKLLEVLQERSFHRVGGNARVDVDVRLIAATNHDLAADVRAGVFREDLYFRLDVVHIELPPLCRRGADVLVLAEHFLEKLAADNRRAVEGFTSSAQRKLLDHDWPGNVRELQNVLERAVVLCEGPQVDAHDLPDFGPTAPGTGVQIPGATLDAIERHAIVTSLKAANGSPRRAAEMLGVSVRLIQYRLHEYGLSETPGVGRRIAPPDRRRPRRVNA